MKDHYQQHLQKPLNLTDISLKVKELSFDALFGYLPISFYWMDTEGILLGCNDKVLQDLKIPSIENFVGKHATEVASVPAWENSKLVMLNKMPLIAEEIHKHDDGKEIIYLSIKNPLYDETNTVIGLLGISIDITQLKLSEEREKKALAEAAEAERAKAKAEQDLRQAVMVLTGSIAHDLRTPISIIDIQGTFLRKYLPVLADAYLQATNNNLSIEDDKPELKSRLKDISDIGDNFKATARQMNEFIDVTLKSLSKVLSNELTQEDLVTCTMWHCLHNSIERYPFSKEEKKLIHKNTSHSFDFMGNEVLIIRVLYSLLKNSLEQIKKQGKGEIFIATEETKNANLLRFKDTAGGAPPEVVEYLFDGYRTTKAGGTGVGLAFCKLTMKSFGGDITCNSVYGEYIEFVLSFPKMNKNPT